MKSILVIQHIDIETPGFILDSLKKNHIEFQTIHANQGASIPLQADDFQGLLFMGGPMGVYEQADYPFLRKELSLIEHALKTQTPLMGICLGSQLIASALGSKITSAKSKEIGWHSIQLTPHAQTDPLFGHFPKHITPLAWHGDIFDPPTNCINLGVSALSPCQAFRYSNFVYGLLFHLETTHEMLKTMVHTFSHELTNASISGEEILKSASQNLSLIEPMAKHFFDQWAQLILSTKPKRS